MTLEPEQPAHQSADQHLVTHNDTPTQLFSLLSCRQTALLGAAFVVRVVGSLSGTFLVYD